MLVWVGATAVMLVAFGAMAVDFGYFYTATNELQTVTDASALAGARALGLSKATDRKPDVDTAAIGMAKANWVMAKQAVITGNNVTLVHWNEAASVVEAAGTGKPINAVQVVDTAQTAFVFGNVFGTVWRRAAPQIPRGAVAWPANVSGATCIRPLGFSMSNIFRMLGIPQRDGPLTDAEVEAFNRLPESSRTVIANPPQNGNGQPSVAIPPYQPYSGLALTGPGGGKPEYQESLAGKCQTSANSIDLNDIYDQPSAMTSRFTTDVFTGSTTGQPPRPPALCNFATGANAKDQTCFNPATGAIGIKFPTAFGLVPTEYGRSKFEVDMLADMTIRCYVRGTPGNGANAGEPQAGATCQSGTNNPTFNDVSSYSGGTIIGVISPNLAFRAGEMKYSDTPSISKTLILVK